MATQEVKSKVAAAERGCERVRTAWVAAHHALHGSVSVNGYGIYSDRFELRNKLTQARRSIDDALQAMDAIEWPTNADYDLL